MIDGSAVILLLRMAVSLTVVLGLIVWAARFLNNRGGSLVRRPRAAVPVAVLGRQSLSRHASLSVVQVGEQILVLGVTDAEVSLLGEVDPATLPEPLDEPELQDAVGHSALVARLTQAGQAVLAKAARPVAQGGPEEAGPQAAPAPTFGGLVQNNLALRRVLKRQAATAQSIVERVAGPDSRMSGRHRG